MAKKNPLFQNPLELIEKDINSLPKGGFGAVLARAGVGKTAFLMQIALGSLITEKNVLHVGLNDPVDKICLRYEEIFRNISKQYNTTKIQQSWEDLLPHRFIMTFKVEGFSTPILEERLTDLIKQKVFFPEMILIDGLPFDEVTRKTLLDLKQIVKRHALYVWFAVRTHRHEKPAPDGIPKPLLHVSDLFEVAIKLQPVNKEIYVKILKGETADSDGPELVLDPASMLIKNRE